MDKSVIKEQLLIAIDAISADYPNLLGVFLFGSIIRDNPTPQDIDILPVLERRESTRENQWLRGNELINEYFKKYFPDFPQPKSIAKTGLHGETNYYWIQNIMDAGWGVVYFTEPEYLRQTVKRTRTGIENFIGTEEAARRVITILL